MDIESLIDEYCSGNVVPILGCELLRINITPEISYNFHEYLIHKSFRPSNEWPKEPTLLSELPLAMPKLNQNTLKGIYERIPEKMIDVSLLTKLAMLENLKTFIMGSSYKEFESELVKINPYEKFDILKNDSKSNHSLSNISPTTDIRKIVYLFDDIESRFFSFSDEELLESIHAISNTANLTSGNTLLSHLSGKTLLFLGCDFSDWYMRYCIRVLSNMPYGKPQRAYIVNDHPAKLNYQEFFFKKHQIELLLSHPVKEFVNEFFSKAKQAEGFDNKFANSRVFISYSNRDLATAKELYSKLRQFGIDPWFDTTDKKIASHEDTIREIIFEPKTKLMISIISKDFVESLQDEKNYVRDIEWDMAICRIKGAKAGKQDDNFCIVPYYIDDPRGYMELLPRYISSEFRHGNLYNSVETLIPEILNYL